jgi:phosphohistidine phosphatase SixA
MQKLSRTLPALGLFVCMGLGAHTPAPATAQPAAPTVNPGSTASRKLPEVAPSVELKGAALLDALRKGGLVLYIRHAQQIQNIPEDCGKKSLTEEGQAQAMKLGAALRAAKVPIGSVMSSPRCRAQETARLLDVGKVETTPDIDYFEKQVQSEFDAAREKRLAAKPAAGTNTVLVSHQHGSTDPSKRMQLELTEVIVFRPDGKGGSVAVARIRPDAWDELVGVAPTKK